jgi:hypothetical protein
MCLFAGASDSGFTLVNPMINQHQPTSTIHNPSSTIINHHQPSLTIINHH